MNVSFQDWGENSRRQQNPFAIFGTAQETTEQTPIVGQIPGQMGRKGLGNKQPRPPFLPPVSQNPNRTRPNPGAETESSEVPLPTQPPLEENPPQVGQRERIAPGQIWSFRDPETTSLPQQPITQYQGESEENLGGFGDGEFSPLPPPPTARNPIQAGRRRTTPSHKWGPRRSEILPSPQPGMRPDETEDEQIGNSGERGPPDPWQSPVNQNRRRTGQNKGVRPGNFGPQRNIPSNPQDDEMESGVGPEYVLGVSKQKETPPLPQPRKRVGSRREMETPMYEDPEQTDHERGRGYIINNRPRQSKGRAPNIYGNEENSEMDSGEGTEKALGDTQQPPQKRTGRGRNIARGRGPYDPRQLSVGQNPIYPAIPSQNMGPEFQIGSNGEEGVTQVSNRQVPRQSGQRRGAGRQASGGRNLPGSQQYPSEGDTNKGDAEVVTSPTFIIQSRRDGRGRSPPTVNRRPGQGIGEEGDLEGGGQIGSRPPRG